jgi:FlaA1/EpsC-like NDP-sugar epimerase
MNRSFLRKLIMAIIDIAIINIALLLAFYLRFDGADRYVVLYNYTYPVVTLLTLASFYKFNLYGRLWKFASVNELISIISATLVATLLTIGYTFMIMDPYPRSVYILYWSLLTTFAGGYRFMLRAYTNINIIGNHKANDAKNVLVIGAGDAGSVVIEEFVKHPGLKRNPVAVIDDDKNKHGMKIRGVRVEGGRDEIPNIVLKKSVHEIIIALPSADRREIREIVQICNKTKCKIKIVPGIYELIDGKVAVQRLRDVKIEDLLGREPVKVNLDQMAGYINGKTVLVTGGAGSIGSELCYQIAGFNPKKLLIFDLNENDVYNLECDLKETFPNLKHISLIGSVRDENRVKHVFQKYRPEVIFHAAAHKHVPLMELNPIEAIKNNVFGTLNVAEASMEYSAERFILISTDKAVNPTNIMGATKRIAEIIIQMMARRSNTVFAAVRFGNVLGSKGSVVPLFKRQIERGGPVTVTHPEVTRYFMTIPEAVQLVIQAGAFANGGEIFILDMGEPVKIIDLAKDMIRLSGLEPNVDIKIQYTGLRPGEKLYEELLLDEEGITATKNEKIYIAKPTYMSVETFLKELEQLKKIILRHRPSKELESSIKRLVPTYKIMPGASGRTSVLH